MTTYVSISKTLYIQNEKSNEELKFIFNITETLFLSYVMYNGFTGMAHQRTVIKHQIIVIWIELRNFN